MMYIIYVFRGYFNQLFQIIYNDLKSESLSYYIFKTH